MKKYFPTYSGPCRAFSLSPRKVKVFEAIARDKAMGVGVFGQQSGPLFCLAAAQNKDQILLVTGGA
ncbi:hypothetical protein [Hymenobacter lapidarius]|uniref:hypothetical protein n=1 Tax=Hymenobacter lapidarius TaxID=1908237 RepID=UPI000F7A284D|nr:hypothetical protein [Hymenobacter lapidarius]